MQGIARPDAGAHAGGRLPTLPRGLVRPALLFGAGYLASREEARRLRLQGLPQLVEVADVLLRWHTDAGAGACTFRGIQRSSSRQHVESDATTPNNVA